MACKRMYYRELRRREAVNAAQEKRMALKEVAANRGWKYTYEEVREAQKKFRRLKRDTSQARMHNRCFVCGRPRGYIGEFGLCRIHFREFALKGLIPGIRFSSW